MKHQARTLRIIGGNWRSRKVTFSDSAEIRPTGDRIRETLFNWLMQETAGSTFLDLFAGSGILGIEALSRGARHVTFVDYDAKSIKGIKENLATLNAENSSYTLSTLNAMSWLKACQSPMDIVFLDPPFSDADLLYDTCQLIDEKKLANNWVYAESQEPLREELLPPGWKTHRNKSSGGVHYSLIST